VLLAASASITGCEAPAQLSLAKIMAGSRQSKGRLASTHFARQSRADRMLPRTGPLLPIVINPGPFAQETMPHPSQSVLPLMPKSGIVRLRSIGQPYCPIKRQPGIGSVPAARFRAGKRSDAAPEPGIRSARHVRRSRSAGQLRRHPAPSGRTGQAGRTGQNVKAGQARFPAGPRARVMVPAMIDWPCRSWQEDTGPTGRRVHGRAGKSADRKVRTARRRPPVGVHRGEMPAGPNPAPDRNRRAGRFKWSASGQ
jgi:hypothetical protein